jgi:putative ABC transport system substrate-binding protein
MRRREFIAGLGGAALWPLVARAQQSRTLVISFLNNASFEGWTDRLRAFSQGLRETGFVEGRNLAIEFHQADGELDRLTALATDLTRRRVNVIVTNGSATLIAKAATATIPIVFFTGANPVELGYVASLNQPGNNLTGVTGLGDALGPKRLQLLHEIVPAATDIGVLVNLGNASNEFQLRDLQAAAKILNLQLRIVNVSTKQDFETGFEGLVRMRVEGLVSTTAPIFNNNVEEIASLAARHRLPAIFQYRAFAAGGGLMALGDDLTEQYRWMGVYTGRILNGEKPSELPVQQATKIQLFVNRTTATALGLTIPVPLLVTAEEVIE